MSIGTLLSSSFAISRLPLFTMAQIVRLFPQFAIIMRPSLSRAMSLLSVHLIRHSFGALRHRVTIRIGYCDDGNNGVTLWLKSNTCFFSNKPLIRNRLVLVWTIRKYYSNICMHSRSRIWRNCNKWLKWIYYLRSIRIRGRCKLAINFQLTTARTLGSSIRTFYSLL